MRTNGTLVTTNNYTWTPTRSLNSLTTSIVWTSQTTLTPPRKAVLTVGVVFNQMLLSVVQPSSWQRLWTILVSEKPHYTTNFCTLPSPWPCFTSECSFTTWDSISFWSSLTHLSQVFNSRIIKCTWTMRVGTFTKRCLSCRVDLCRIVCYSCSSCLCATYRKGSSTASQLCSARLSLGMGCWWLWTLYLSWL